MTGLTGQTCINADCLATLAVRLNQAVEAITIKTGWDTGYRTEDDYLAAIQGAKREN